MKRAAQQSTPAGCRTVMFSVCAIGLSAEIVISRSRALSRHRPRQLHQLDYLARRGIMALLTLGHDYSREEVHAIFAPGTRFTRQAGTWGPQGIIQVPNRPGDFVLFRHLGIER